jgi:Tol biopolymer transport system component
MWTGDGREILYVKRGEEIATLLRLPADGSRQSQAVSSLGVLGSHLAISRQGDKLVYVSSSADSDIWRVELPARGRKGPSVSAVRFASSSRVDQTPQISPDGKRVTFGSSRSGNLEIWVAEADGSNALQLTWLGGPAALDPRWSPDAKEIVFHANVDGNDDLYVVSAVGGKLRRLTRGAGNNICASWSRDGHCIYFASNRSGDFQCWKIPWLPSGPGGEAVQVTRGGGCGGFESPDGKFLYYAKSLISGAVWRVSVAGGEEQPVHESVRALRFPPNFAVAAQGIYSASSADPLHGFNLQLYRLATGGLETLGRINVSLGRGIAASPDGRWLLFADDPVRRGDLTLVENFR